MDLQESFDRWRRSGDTGLLAQIVAEICRREERHIRRLGGPFYGSTTVSDLCQIAQLEALRAPPVAEMDELGRLYAWVRTVLRNQVVSRIRRRLARPTSELSETDIEGLLGPDADSAELERAELSELLWMTVHSLPDRYRDALLYRYREGLSIEAIGHTLELSRGATDMLLHRARLTLRDALEPRLPEL